MYKKIAFGLILGLMLVVFSGCAHQHEYSPYGYDYNYYGNAPYYDDNYRYYYDNGPYGYYQQSPPWWSSPALR